MNVTFKTLHNSLYEPTVVMYEIGVVIIVFVRMRLLVIIHFRFPSINTMCTIMIVIHLLLCHWDSSERGRDTTPTASP